MARRPQKLQGIQTPDEGVCILPFTLQFVSGAPVIVEGDTVASVADTGTGKFTLTFRDRFAKCFGAPVSLSFSDDTTDLSAQSDWSALVSAGTLVIRTKAGTANADPPANAFIGGCVIVKKTTRRARGG